MCDLVQRAATLFATATLAHRHKTYRGAGPATALRELDVTAIHVDADQLLVLGPGTLEWRRERAQARAGDRQRARQTAVEIVGVYRCHTSALLRPGTPRRNRVPRLVVEPPHEVALPGIVAIPDLDAEGRRARDRLQPSTVFVGIDGAARRS